MILSVHLALGVAIRAYSISLRSARTEQVWGYAASQHKQQQQCWGTIEKKKNEGESKPSSDDSTSEKSEESKPESEKTLEDYAREDEQRRNTD